MIERITGLETPLKNSPEKHKSGRFATISDEGVCLSLSQNSEGYRDNIRVKLGPAVFPEFLKAHI